MLVTKHSLGTIDYHSRNKTTLVVNGDLGTVWLDTFFKICVHLFFIFGWTIPLTLYNHYTFYIVSNYLKKV